MASLNYDYWNALKQPSVLLLLLFFTDPACEKLINLLWRITHVQHKSTYFIQSNITVESILVIVVKLHQDCEQSLLRSCTERGSTNCTENGMRGGRDRKSKPNPNLSLPPVLLLPHSPHGSRFHAWYTISGGTARNLDYTIMQMLVQAAHMCTMCFLMNSHLVGHLFLEVTSGINSIKKVQRYLLEL